jgi:hypothetical protein
MPDDFKIFRSYNVALLLIQFFPFQFEFDKKKKKNSDKKTRELGYLVKVVSVVDQNNSGAPDRRFFNILSNASKLSEVYYPQLLGTSVLINLRTNFFFLPSLSHRSDNYQIF